MVVGPVRIAVQVNRVLVNLASSMEAEVDASMMVVAVVEAPLLPLLLPPLLLLPRPEELVDCTVEQQDLVRSIYLRLQGAMENQVQN